MRVTTGMLNRNRGGVMGSRKSLLSHIQRNREGGIAGLKALGAVRSESAMRSWEMRRTAWSVRQTDWLKRWIRGVRK